MPRYGEKKKKKEECCGGGGVLSVRKGNAKDNKRVLGLEFSAKKRKVGGSATQTGQCLHKRKVFCRKTRRVSKKHLRGTVERIFHSALKVSQRTLSQEGQGRSKGCHARIGVELLKNTDAHNNRY